MLAVIVTIMTITWRSIDNPSSYCDNNDNNGTSIGSVIINCDNNGKVYV
jgi:hypothetical protein